MVDTDVCFVVDDDATVVDSVLTVPDVTAPTLLIDVAE